MPRPPSTWTADHDRESDRRGDLSRLFTRRRRAAGGLRDAEIRQQPRETLAILGEVDRVGRRAHDLHAGRLQRQRELQRRLPAELHEARDVAAAADLLLITDITSSNVSGSK
jgi:hypothetical protein